MHSPYMHWAKTHFHAKYNLANSGLTNYPLTGLHVELKELELTGSSYYGYEPLLHAIGERYNVTTKQIYTTLGTSFANFMVLTLLFEPGAEILIEHPTYELLISTAQHVGYKVKRFHRRFEDNFQIDISALKKSVTPKTRLIILTNLHNPSSALTDDKILKEIGKIARSVGAYICVDEVYLDSAFELSLRSSISLGKEFIITNSLTKVYGISGLRCGWVFAKPELVQKMWYLTDLFYVKHAHIAEQLSVTAFQNLDKIKEWSRSNLEQNHRLLNKFLDTRKELEVFRPGYGTVVFPRLKKGNVEDLYKLLENKYDTAITPGRFFEMPDFFRIGLGCKPSIFKIGLHNISKALDELRLSSN